MRVEAISYQPYIYNTNVLNGNSLNRVNRIGDDLLDSRKDFSGLADKAENTNPLRMGETLNFADVLQKQMRMGRMNAARLMRPGQEPEPREDEREEVRKADEAVRARQFQAGNNDTYQRQRAMQAYMAFV